MNIDIKNKKPLYIIGAVALAVVIGIYMFAAPLPDHIEDKNGADDYSLHTIKERDIVDKEMGSRGGVGTKKSKFSFGNVSVSDGVKYYCKKFTGVQLMYSAYLFKGSDIHLQLTEFKIEEGNFGFYIVFDGEVVGQVESDEFGNAEFLLENVEKSGTLEYVIAGESANFSFVSDTEW